MKVLITGGAGFIGTNITKKLLNDGMEIVILDTLSEQIHGDIRDQDKVLKVMGKYVEFIKGDVRDENLVKSIIGKVDYIIHLAAETGTGQSMYEISKYVDVNVNGTATILNSLANIKNNVSKVIIASSRAIYGEGKYLCDEHGFVYPDSRDIKDLEIGNFETRCPYCKRFVKLCATDENSKIHPTSIYGITKHTQESLVAETCKSLGISSIGLRYQNVYGPGQSLKNPYTGIISIFSNLIKMDKKIEIFEDGKESRDFVYIDDVVDATVKSLKKSENINESINIGSGVPVNVNKLVGILYNLYKKQTNINNSGRYRIGDIRHNYADVSKAEKLLNFKPTVFLEEGLSSFVEWVDTQEIIDINYKKSLKEMEEKGLYK